MKLLKTLELQGMSSQNEDVKMSEEEMLQVLGGNVESYDSNSDKCNKCDKCDKCTWFC